MTTKKKKKLESVWASVIKQRGPHVGPMAAVRTAIDVLDGRLAAMAARIAERDLQLARLRREMDALREGLRSAHDPELIAHDVMVAAKAVAP